jgi:hypothetical protein
VVRPEIADEYDAAAECNCDANSFQAVAAASIGPAPGPVYIRPELISGGSIPKSIAMPPYLGAIAFAMCEISRCFTRSREVFFTMVEGAQHAGIQRMMETEPNGGQTREVTIAGMLVEVRVGNP